MQYIIMITMSLFQQSFVILITSFQMFSVILFLFNFSSEFLTMLPVSARPALPVLLPDSSQSW